MGRERPASLQKPSLCTAVLVQVFCILPFGLTGFSLEQGSLPVCFRFLYQFPKQRGRSMLGMDVAAPTPELLFKLAAKNFPCEPEPNYYISPSPLPFLLP